MNKRRNYLQNMCFKLGLDVPGNDTIHRPNPWEFLINRDYKLVWCNVFKAASTSWMYNFNLLAGYSPQFLKKTKLVPLTIARKRYPRPSVQELEMAMDDSVSFLIVRHPLERLLSAYRDKMQLSLPLTYHQKLGKRIISKYRRKKNVSNSVQKPWLFAASHLKEGTIYSKWPPTKALEQTLADFLEACARNRMWVDYTTHALHYIYSIPFYVSG